MERPGIAFVFESFTAFEKSLYFLYTLEFLSFFFVAYILAFVDVVIVPSGFISTSFDISAWYIRPLYIL